MKIRVLVANEPEPIGGVTCWRMYWPLDHLDRNYSDTLDIRYSRGQIIPVDLYWADILLCYRPSEPAHIAVMEEAKRVGCKILLDYDDDLTSLPTGHPEFWRLGQKHQYIKRAHELADAVWVSTEALAKKSTNKNTTVIPNAIQPERLPVAPADFSKKTVVWAGSPAHADDATALKDEYLKIIGAADRFIWINYMPTWASSMKSRSDVQLSPWVHTEQYFQWLREQNTVAIWKPLISNEFNKSKSNIAYITATMCGGVCITNQARSEQWEFALRYLPKSQAEFSKAWEMARADVAAHYDLHRWNDVRHRELLKLAS